MAESASSATSGSGNISFGDDSPSWIMPAIIGGAILLAALAWLLTRKEN